MNADVVILGGGCAGLSLARDLARLPAAPKTLVLESREAYEDDRTWCFWTPHGEHPLSHLVSRRWRSWRFSTGQRSALHAAAGETRYQCVRANDFYDDARAAIDAAPHVTLRLGASVQGVHPRAHAAEVHTRGGPVRARWVVDTRPPRVDANAGTLRQVFRGAEVRTAHPVFEPDVVGLMQNMSVDEHGFRFTYVLPFSRTHGLIEETRFTDTAPPPGRLAADLASTMEAAGVSDPAVVRTEAGTIPMTTALPSPAASDSGPLVRAGTAGGAVRPSSGYAFLRINAWAAHCARRLAAGQAPCAHPADPPWRRAADRLFLRVIQRRPEVAPSAFQAMGEQLAAETFVRFMSDQGRLMDLAGMAMALPKRPFIEELCSAATETGRAWRVRA